MRLALPGKTPCKEVGPPRAAPERETGEKRSDLLSTRTCWPYMVTEERCGRFQQHDGKERAGGGGGARRLSGPMGSERTACCQTRESVEGAGRQLLSGPMGSERSACQRESVEGGGTTAAHWTNGKRAPCLLSYKGVGGGGGTTAAQRTNGNASVQGCQIGRGILATLASACLSDGDLAEGAGRQQLTVTNGMRAHCLSDREFHQLDKLIKR